MSALAIGCVLLIWMLWPSSSFTPSIKLPPGVSLAEALKSGTNQIAKGWAAKASSPDFKLGLWERARWTAEKVRAEIHEKIGKTLCRAPSQPTVDYVTPRLAESSDSSGEKYLLAKEFSWQVDRPALAEPEWTYLAFVWGGTNQLRYSRDVTAMIEEGIVNHGVFGLHVIFPQPGQHGRTTFEYYRTNRCAIVRDTKGFVKVLPLDCLKAYADAGLISLPNQK